MIASLLLHKRSVEMQAQTCSMRFECEVFILKSKIYFVVHLKQVEKGYCCLLF